MTLLQKTIIVLNSFIAVICHGQTGRSNHSLSQVDSGILIITLGRDTTRILSYQINGNEISSQIITMPGGILVTKATGTLNPDGSLQSLVSKMFRIDSSGELKTEQITILRAIRDSTYITITKADKIQKEQFKGTCIFANVGDPTLYSFFPFWSFYAPEIINDSVKRNYYVAGGLIIPYFIKRTSKDTLIAGNNTNGHITLELLNGKLMSINAIGTTQNVTGYVHRDLNFDSLFLTRVTAERKMGKMPEITRKDSVTFRKNNLIVNIFYWQPSVRGRKIFGAVVPWNQIWRTGANNATEIEINNPITFNGQKLNAGRYSIFTRPEEQKWTIIFNRKINIWGLSYDSTQDVLRIPMEVEKMSDLVEKLRFSIVETKEGGIISIEWEHTKANVNFKAN